MDAHRTEIGKDSHDYAHISRLFELWTGDPDFRRCATTQPGERVAMAAKYGVRLSDDFLNPFWRLFEDTVRSRESAKAAEMVFAESGPGASWIAWNNDHFKRLSRIRDERIRTGIPRVDAWRSRQTARANSQAYRSPYSFAPPLFALELSKGCSRQCWFCAFSPEKLKANFLHTPPNARLWKDVLGYIGDRFGAASRTAVLYHSTEPTDNPDYLDFLQDYHDLYGSHSQTTTVQPLKDLAWTRRLLAMREADPTSRDRFSVLSLKALRDIFLAFTPEELLQVDLAIHNAGALSERNHCGNAIAHPARLSKEQDLLRQARFSADAPLPQLTLECTIGYLVNMVEGSIKLVSPCNASEQWPLGYQVFAHGTFDGLQSFAAFVERSIEKCMPERLPAARVLRFRDDLLVDVADDSVLLTSRFQRHRLQGDRHLPRLARLVSEGAHTSSDVAGRLSQEGMPWFTAVGWIDRMYERGYFSE